MPLSDEFLLHFVDREDFCHPDWPAIIEQLRKSAYAADDLAALWRDLVLAWLERLRVKLGVAYKIYESNHFFMLANPVDKLAADYVAFLEKARRSIHESLGDVVWKSGHGKHVVLLFDADEDYYRYIAPFYAEGEHPTSGGVFLRSGGYAHIALPFVKGEMTRTLAHEYAHNCLCQLPLPKWLDEALAMRFEDLLVPGRRARLDFEACQKHDAYWNEVTIQDFWSGKSWSIPDGTSTLSYELARVLMDKIEHIVRPSKKQLMSFIREAHRRDAGKQSMQTHFQVQLGELAADFLGDHNWEPRPEIWANAEIARKS